MKPLHRPDLFSRAAFDEPRITDFCGQQRAGSLNLLPDAKLADHAG